ncbi:hypothetical protein [Paenibacillus alginolyticus]|uniref:Uncharacterized protein n=1 Tax=Paenibacillus alginolyticus TaxID=59839 RepID=A0ABT4G8M8_9BACL|nr:hypothetical protein [Paenibacillus alginolyticus]MCY9692541.1 hypothetical protein [Paenibacillus alginolyticus]MEC0143747.1 hypothetical protein [Paenibacillus alginolyticus]
MSEKKVIRSGKANEPAKEAGKEQRPRGQALRTKKSATALSEPAPLSGTEQMSLGWQQFYKVVSKEVKPSCKLD